MADKVAIVVGGGPAPGINGVISAASIEAINQGKEAIGIIDGFKWLARGDTDHTRPLTLSHVSRIHLKGGSILRTSRENPTKSPEKMANVVRALNSLGVRYLVTIGGDDTAYTASQVEKEAKGKIAVCHVPKTIDNDLPLPPDVPTFGYDTARELGALLVQNLMEDAQTAARWYFVIAMGRSAGHLALSMGAGAGATMTLIPEELGETYSLRKVLNILEGAIIKRLAAGKDHGVAVIAEGVAARLDPESFSFVKDAPRDEHGNIRLAEIPFGTILKNEVKRELQEMGIKTTIVAKDIGYELRCNSPTAFDRQYTRNLGYSAVRFLLEGVTGSMVLLQEGRTKPIPFEELMDPMTGKTRVRTVDPNSEVFQVARRYMIRLNAEDLKGESLKQLAAAARMNPESFLERFAELE
jgi:6-phosphofructokinase 1